MPLFFLENVVLLLLDVAFIVDVVFVSNFSFKYIAATKFMKVAERFSNLPISEYLTLKFAAARLSSNVSKLRRAYIFPLLLVTPMLLLFVRRQCRAVT